MSERPADERPATDEDSRLKARLAYGRVTTHAVMLIERIWPLILPLILIACTFLGLSWLGVFAALPQVPRLALVAIIGLAALATLYPLRFFQSPTTVEIDRRLEIANALPHNPILAQNDQPSGHETAFSQALWREHQRRMARRLDNLGADLPQTRIPDYDRWGLRALPILLLVVGFAVSLGSGGGSIQDAFRLHAMTEAVPPRIDAWVTPPPYTNTPPLFLSAAAPGSIFTVPAGSQFTVRVTGGSGAETLNYTGKSDPARQFEPAETQSISQTASAARKFTGRIDYDGALVLAARSREIGRWIFTVTPDTPPKIELVGEPTQAANGSLELKYRIVDDYGAAKASAQFSLADAHKPDTHPLYAAPEMPLALPRGGGKADTARTTKDLTQHVWSGSAVHLTLTATDDAGQTARSETRTFVMPERPFANPLARAIIEQRKILGLDANAKPLVLQMMDAITLRPEDTFSDTGSNMGHYLAIMSARSRLKLASSDDQLRNVVSYLWDIALGIEEGDLSAAEKRLRQAQQNLQNLLKNGGSDEEIAKAMQELRQAMNDYLREFAQRQQQQQSARIPGNAQELRPSDLDRMMDQIENLARSGNREKAQELLSQLENMMNNLQAGQPGQPSEQNNEMRQQMNKLGEIMRRQQEMMNETFRMDQMQRGQNRDRQMGESDDPGMEEPFGQQPGQNGEPRSGQMSPREFSDAMKRLQREQGRLRGDLEQLGKGLEGLGMTPNRGFGEAGDAMDDAGKALGEGQGQDAVADQGRALEALRQGARDLMQQLQAMRRDQGGTMQSGRQNADRDPLGRPRATNGPDFGDSVKVPDEIDVQRARRILDAIRKRLGDALAPDIERSYLERLLDLK